MSETELRRALIESDGKIADLRLRVESLAREGLQMAAELVFVRGGDIPQTIEAARAVLVLRTHELEAKLATVLARERELEKKYRARLWLGHPHTGQYGDDGEMQCFKCYRLGAGDYRRDPIEKLEQSVYLAVLEAALTLLRQEGLIE